MNRIERESDFVVDYCSVRCHRWRAAILAMVMLLAANLVDAQVSVTTYQYNSQRTGVNSNETVLTPSNVNVNNFGKLFSQPVDGNIYAQPLYVPGLTINGVPHNVVFVATENDSVYAFDADSNTGTNVQPLWQASFIPQGATTVSDNICTDINPQYGITGTPVIDPSTNILYAVGETYEGGSYVKRLHALNILTGSEMPGSPLVITATVTVPGQDAVIFDSLWENQRAGLLFYNGVVYIAFGSHCDGGVWQGWILGYSYGNSNLNQVFVYTTEPSSLSGAGGGIWMSGQGLAMDAGYNLFVGTGNGTFDTNITPPLDYGDSIIRIDLSQGPIVQDYFAPGVEATLDSQNQDLGSGGVAILPQQPGSYPNLLVTADKYQTIYLLNRANLGQYNATSDDVVQELTGVIGSMFSSPVYFNGKVYFWAAKDVLKAFTLTNGMLSTSATDEGPDLFHFPGAVPTISASGTSNAILWALESDGYKTNGPAVLYAYLPGSLAAGSIYNSSQNLGRDNPGGAIKFAVPIVVNGKVYVGTTNQLSVFGELSATTPTITSASNTTFTVGTAGGFTVTTTGTPTPALSESGILPSGVTFVDNGNGTGTLSGTPASGTAGSYPVTLTATNSVATTNQSFTLTVAIVASTAPTITSANNTAFTVGEMESFTVTTTGIPTPGLGESGTLPSGVTFVDNGNGMGTLSGTAASGTAGSYSVTITASSSAGIANQTFTLTVNNIAGSGGGNGSWGQIDAWLQMTTSTPGTTLTTSILSAGTVGGVLASNILGETAVAGTPSGNADVVLATPFVTGSDSRGYNVLSLSGYNGGVSTSANFDLGIYSDNSGSPGNLLCHAGTTLLTPGVWNFITLPLSSSGCPTLVATTQYWVAYITDSNSIGQSFEQGICPGTSLSSVESSSRQGSAVLPSSFGTNTAFPSECYSLYVTANDISGALVWNVIPNPPTGFAVGASQGSLGGTITVDGTTYPASTTTQSLALDNGATVPLYAQTTSSFLTPSGAVIPTVVVNGYITPGPANVGDNGVNFGLVTLFSRTGDYVTLQLNSGNGDGSSHCYCVKLETDGGTGGTTIDSSNIALNPNQRYSFSLLFDVAGGVAKLAMFDPSNAFAQIGSTVTVAQVTGGSLGELWLGNDEDGTSSGNTTYFEDIMLDWTNHIFPNSPGTSGNTAPAITSAGSTTFTVGTSGSFSVTTTGTPTPLLSESGPLPSGVTFTDNGNGTGTLTGTAATGTAGSYPITITANSSAGTANQSFTLTVNDASAAPTITSANSTTLTVGTAGSFTVGTTGAPTPSLSETGTLANGITFVDNGNGTATLGGTATGPGGNYPITIAASNSAGTANQSFTLSVNQSPAITSASGTTFVTGTGSSFTVATTGTPTPSLRESGTLPNGITFVDNGNGTATLSGTAASGTAGGYPITITAGNSAGTTNQSFTLTVNQGPAITSPSTETFTVGTAGSFMVTTTGTPTPTLSETGSLPNGVTFTNNGNGTGTLSGTPASGSGASYPITIAATNSAGTASQSFTLTVNQGPAITSPSTATFTVGTAGSFTVTTTGTPTPTLSETGTLPNGVTFTNNGNGTGTLSGMPTSGTVGSYPITISASNAAGNASQGFTLIVNQGPAITSPTSTTFTVGTAGSFTVTTTGTPAPSLTGTGTLPSGVIFTNTGTGTATISGAPSAGSGGTYSLIIAASNSVGTASQSFTLTVNQSPAITSPGGATFVLGTAGSFPVTTTGTPAPSLTETGTLPGGLTFVNNGNGTATLSGTASAKGNYTITITASNGVGTAATQRFTLTVDQAPAITSGKSTTFKVGTAGTFKVTATGLPAPVLSESGTLPGGVTFKDNGNGTATLSGTPASGTGATYPITITANNSVGTTTESFTLTVNQTAAITSANNTTFTAGAAGSFTVMATGAPTPSLSKTGALPNGLTFTNNKNGTATLGGTPGAKTGGTYSITIMASNITGTASQSFTLTVDQAPAITSAKGTTFTVGTAGSFNVTTTGMPAPSITETGTLPSGVTFLDNGNGTATLSGIPATETLGKYPITITAGNGTGTMSQSFTLMVN